MVLRKGNLTKYIFFDRRQLALFSFSLRFSRRNFNVRCSSSISPGYFVLQIDIYSLPFYPKIHVLDNCFVFRSKKSKFCLA